MKYFNETYIKRKFLTRNEWSDTYKAIHATTEEKVMLKVLVRKSNDEEYINNLLKEVEIVKNIKHPNLINVNNMFKYSGCGKTYYYIEGEYFKGISLEEKLCENKFHEKEAVKIVEEISQGLKEFHSRNLSFNCLNIKNIFVNKKDIIKADVLSYLENKKFPVKIVEDEGQEQQIQIEEEFDVEKDIHDLGIILYSLLTGNLTFDSKNYKKEISNENLIGIIEKSTNLNLESKYRNIDRFILDLKSFMQSGDLSDETYDVEEVIVDKKKRKKGKVGKTIGICAAVVIVGGAAVYAYDLLEKNKKEEQVNITKIEETTKPKKEDKKTEENKEDKIEKDKTMDKKDEESSKKNSSTSDSNKNTNSSIKSDKNNNSNHSSNSNPSSNSSSNGSNNNSSVNNSNSNSSNNNTSKPNKPSKPNNNAGSGNTSTKPNEGNDTNVEKPEVTPPSDDSSNNNSGSENTTPEATEPDTSNE